MAGSGGGRGVGEVEGLHRGCENDERPEPK
jgi:hypothetical protein